MQGRMLLTEYYAGMPVRDPEARIDLNGPFDDNFYLTFAGYEGVWSSCTNDFTLNVRTQINLRKTADAGSAQGYLSMNNVDSSNGDLSLKAKLGWRRCD
jgi:hypothetical protein